MKELVVISGKGGTGKTSIVASFATLAKNQAVLADCDVDAADLHLVLEPEIIHTEDFFGGLRAKINADLCIACGKCQDLCRFNAISQSSAAWATGSDASWACRDCSFCVRSCSSRTNATIHDMMESPGSAGNEIFKVDPIACEGCGVCNWFCPVDAIEFAPAVNGQWFLSDTRFGPMVHAKLGIAEDSSGKLVSLLRSEARKIAEARGLDTIIIDGSPGIGCPVIASITGANLVLIVTEPTLSGLHDFERVAELTKFFGIETLICINKWDINPDITTQIERQAEQRNLALAGRVRYDKAVTTAQVHKQTVVEYQPSGCAEDIRDESNVSDSPPRATFPIGSRSVDPVLPRSGHAFCPMCLSQPRSF
jgi:MinD superfamily P-loop ATPase